MTDGAFVGRCFRPRSGGDERAGGTDLDEAGLDALNTAILRTVRVRGRAVPSSARLDGRFAIRPCPRGVIPSPPRRFMADDSLP